MTNMRSVYSQQLPWIKTYNPKTNDGRRDLAYASIFKAMYKDSSKECKKFSTICDKKLNDKNKQLSNGVMLTKEVIEKALSSAILMGTLEHNICAIRNNNRNQDWMTPLAIDIFEIAINGDMESAIAKVQSLPEDYAFESRLEGQLLMLINAIHDEEWGAVQATIATAAISAQMIPSEFPYQMLLGEYVRQNVPKQHLPWMMRGLRTEVIAGEYYYCMPFMMSTLGILDQYRIHEKDTNVVAEKAPNTIDMIPQYRDRHGKVYVSGSTLFAGKVAEGTINTINSLGAAVTSAALKVAQHMQKGTWSGYIGMGCLTEIKSSKSTLFPMGSCGYVISRDPSVFSEWNSAISANRISTDKLSQYDGFFNFIDGEYYDTGKTHLPQSLKNILSDIQ